MPDSSQQFPKHAGGKRPAVWRRWTVRLRWLTFLALSFAIIFAGIYWIAPMRPLATLHVYEGTYHLRFSPDSSVLVTGTADNYLTGNKSHLQCWDVEKGVERFSIAPRYYQERHFKFERAFFSPHFAPDRDEPFLFSPDGKLIAVNDPEGHLRVWNTTTGKELSLLTPPAEVGHCLALLRLLYSAFSDDVPSFLTPDAEFGLFPIFRFSPDGASLAVQKRHGDYITFYDLKANRRRETLKADLTSLAFAPDGKSFATCMKKDESDVIWVSLWKQDRDDVPTLVKEHNLEAKYLCFSPDLRTIALAVYPPNGAPRVEIWDMANGVRRHSFAYQENGASFDSLSFAGNGRLLVAKGERHADRLWQTTLWDASTTPKEIAAFLEDYPKSSPKGDWAMACQETCPIISPTGDWMAVRTKEGIKLLKLPTLEYAGTLRMNFDQEWHVRPVTFSPDGKLLLQEVNYSRPDHFLSKWLPERFNPFAHKEGYVVKIWDMATRAQVASLYGTSAAEFSPDGKWLATVRYPDANIVEIWTLPICKPILGIVLWSLAAWLLVVLASAILLRARRRWLSSARPGMVPTVPPPTSATDRA